MRFTDIHAVASRFTVRVLVQPVLHFDAQAGRLIGIRGIEAVKAPVGRNDREVRFAGKIPDSRLDPDHIAGPVGFACDQIRAAQVYIRHLRREQDVHGFGERYLDAVRFYHLLVGERFAGSHLGKARQRQTQARRKNDRFFHCLLFRNQ